MFIICSPSAMCTADQSIYHLIFFKLLCILYKSQTIDTVQQLL